MGKEGGDSRKSAGIGIDMDGGAGNEVRF